MQSRFLLGLRRLEHFGVTWVFIPLQKFTPVPSSNTLFNQQQSMKFTFLSCFPSLFKPPGDDNSSKPISSPNVPW